MAKKGICAAVAMALARNLVLLRNQISRSQPGRGPPPHWHAEFLASGVVLALAQLPRDGRTALDSPMPRKFQMKLVSEFFRALALVLDASWFPRLVWGQVALRSSEFF